MCNLGSFCHISHPSSLVDSAFFFSSDDGDVSCRLAVCPRGVGKANPVRLVLVFKVTKEDHCCIPRVNSQRLDEN